MTDSLALRTGETVLRDDDVVLMKTSSTRLWFETGNLGTGRVALMRITSQRLVFLHPQKVPWQLKLHSLIGEFYVELTDIERFETWHPEFSGPPMFITEEGSWTFDLVAAWKNRKKAAETVRGHFREVEGVWLAAKAARSAGM